MCTGIRTKTEVIPKPERNDILTSSIEEIVECMVVERPIEFVKELTTMVNLFLALVLPRLMVSPVLGEPLRRLAEPLALLDMLAVLSLALP